MSLQSLKKNELLCLAYILEINGNEIFGDSEKMHLRKNGLVRLIRKNILTVRQKTLTANFLAVIQDKNGIIKEEIRYG